jgi:integrase
MPERSRPFSSETQRTENVSSPQDPKQAKQRRRLSKTHLDYWRTRIRRPLYTVQGVVHQVPNFAVEVQYRGKRRNWTLGIPNQDAAAARAKEIFLFLQANGWEATIQKYRPPILAERKANITVGGYIAEVQKIASGKGRTVEAYARALRKIVADIFNVPGKTSKFDYYGGRARWRESIDSRRLAELTPQKIQEWKRDFIARAGHDPIEVRSARTSVNTFLRCAKCLFSPEILLHLAHVELPDPLPFSRVEFEPRQNTKYYSRINVKELIGKAREGLAPKHPEPFKIFCLALFAGLRRLEIDLLEWPSFQWEESTLRIMPTRYFHPKTEDSIADVPIEAELVELFRGYRARATGPFVIEANQPPRPELMYTYYRAQEHFDFLVGWLRNQGIEGEKPIHVLRKEYGSLLCTRAGLLAASRGLRHSNVAVTAAVYVDSTPRAVTGLGGLLTAGNIVPLPPPKKTRRRSGK